MTFLPSNGKTRREFIALGGKTALAAMLADAIPVWVRQALAEEKTYEFPNLVAFRTFGAMDVTLGLDPLVMPADCTQEDVFIEYKPEQIIAAEGLKFGPACEPLKPYAKRCLSVNGVMMRRDAGHDVINQYMLSGRGDGKAASIPAEIALATGGAPFGILMNTSIYLAGKSVILSSTKELESEAANETLANLIEEKIAASIPTGTPLEEAEKAIVAAREKARELTVMLQAMTKEHGKLTDMHILAAAFATGACRQAQLDLATPGQGLDTHANHEGNHLTTQKAVWEQVASFFKLLETTVVKDKPLFDNTLVMVISEFSRTPALNAAKGKDHNPFTNSVLLAGPGINGGTTVGSSKIIPLKKSKTGMPEHYATPFNYKTGKPATSPEGASFFYPENFIRTLAKLYGDPPNFKAVAKDLPVIPGILKA